MRQPPSVPPDRLLQEWNRPKTWQEWRRFNAKKTPLRCELEQFCASLIYFAGSDLCYLDAGLLQRPTAPVLFSLEYIASQLDHDAEALAAFWIIRGELADRERRWNAQHRILDSWGASARRLRMDEIERAAALVGQASARLEGAAGDNHRNIQCEEESESILKNLVTFRDRQAAEFPARTWYVEGMFCPGFNMVTAKKAMGKTFLLLQAADAIAEGAPFLGRRTTMAKVLYVGFELDELDASERFKGMHQLSENAFIVHSWPAEEEGLGLAERVIREYGFQVIIFDTFLPLLPPPSTFEINGYGDSTLYLKWRLRGKRTGTAFVASWHEGKSPRDDYMLSAIGSTGMVGQADSVVSIDRKRGDSTGKLLIGGNHAPESAIPFFFENGIFTLAEGEAAVEHLTPVEERTLDILAKSSGGCTAAKVGLELGKTNHAALCTLNRLIARGKISRVKRGLYVSESLKSSQMTFGDNGRKSQNVSPPLRGETSGDLLRLAKFPDKTFLLWHNFPYGEGKKEAREATEATPEGGRAFRAGRAAVQRRSALTGQSPKRERMVAGMAQRGYKGVERLHARWQKAAIGQVAAGAGGEGTASWGYRSWMGNRIVVVAPRGEAHQ